MLSIKIRLITETEQTKVMKFAETMAVGEVIQQIREKTGIGGPDFGLFQPTRRKKDMKPRWLKNDKSLVSYEIESDQVLEYKKRHRLQKVKLLDQTQKMILIDDAMTVQDMVALIGEKMGLKNVEEFSLQVEGSVEGDWLQPHMTLHEQNVSNDSVLMLKKKFFVTDANVDTENPLTLHYLYLQSMSQVLAGQHPLTPDEALSFAALQCQIHYGNFDPEKHKAGFLKGKMKDYLPPQHQKIKDAEAQIFRTYKKFVGMSETNAKMRFVQLCRSLKTYGITYFNAKESPAGSKQANPKKAKPILLGITRDSFLRIDPETKEMLTSYPLTHIRRWAATKNNFTLDVGDYSESYSHFTTPDAEKISQLLTGYIDIILKRTRDNARITEDDESMIASEEEVGIVRSVALATMVTNLSVGGQNSSEVVTQPSTTTYKGPGYGPSTTKLVIANKNTANQALSTLIDALSGSLTDTHMPNNNAPERAVELLQEYSAALTGVAIPLLDIGRIDGEAGRLQLDVLSKQVGIQASKLADAAVMSAMGNPYGANMIDAAKKVCTAMKDLLENAETLSHSPNDAAAKASANKSAQLFKVAKVQLQTAPTGKLLDRPSQDLLNSEASALAFSVDDLLKVAQEEVLEEPKAKAIVTTTAQVAEEVVNAISTYAPLLLIPEYKTFLSDPLKAFDSQVVGFDEIRGSLPTSIVSSFENAKKCFEQIYGAIASNVTEEVMARPKRLAESSKGISMATARLLSSVGMGDVVLVNSSSDAVKASVEAMVTTARNAGNSAKDKQTAQSLSAACDLVTDALKAVIANARVATEDPGNEGKQAQLLSATQKLASSAQKLVGNAEKETARNELRTATKTVITSALPLTLAAKTVGKNSSNPNPELLRLAKATSDSIMELINALNQDEKNNSDTPERLLTATRETSVALGNLIASSKAAAPAIADFVSRNNLQMQAEASARNLNELLAATKAIVDAAGGTEFEDALQAISVGESSLDAALITSSSGTLRQATGQTEENAAQLLTVAAKSFAQVSDKLVASIRSQNGAVAIGASAKAVGQGVSRVINSANTFASATSNKETQQRALQATKELLSASSSLITAAKAAASNPADEILSKLLQNSVAAVADQVTNVINSIRSSDDPVAKDCDAAVETIQAEIVRLTPNAFSSGDFATFADEVDSCNKALQAAISQVLDSAQSNPKDLGVAAQTTSGIISSLINVANLAAATCKKDEDKYNLIDSTRKLSQSVIRLLGSAKASAMNKDDTELRTELRKHSKAVAENMDAVSNSLSSAIPGIKQSDNALQEIGRAVSQLGTPLIIDAPKSSGSVMEELTNAAKELASSTAKIISNARSNPEVCGQYALSAAAAVAKILNVTRPTTVAATSANSEQLKDFLDPAKKVEEAVKILIESEGKPSNIIGAMKTIANATSDIVANTKTMATTLKDPSSQQKLLKAAQAMAEPSSKLVATAKAAAQKLPNSQKPMVQAAGELQDAINTILAAATSVLPGTAESDSPHQEVEQLDHLVNSAKSLASSTSSLIEASRTVSLKPKETTAHFELSKAAKNVSDAIQALLGSAQGLAPDYVRCDEALERIASSMENLDASLLSVAVGGLDIETEKDHQDTKEQLITDSVSLSGSIAKLVNSALNKNAAEIGENASDTANTINSLVHSASLAAATTTDIKSQKQLLELAKIVSESVMGLLNVIKSGEQVQIADKARESSDAIKNLVSTLKLGVVGARDCDEAGKAILASVKTLDLPIEPSGKSFKQCKDELAASNKALVASIQQLVTAAKSNVAELGPTSRAVAETISKVIQSTKNGLSASANPAVREALINSGKSVAGAVREIIINSKVLASDQSNPNSTKKLALSQKSLNDAVEHLINAFSSGEIDCEDAIEEIRGTIANLDAASLFASAGQLTSDEKNVSTLEESQQNLGFTCKELETLANKTMEANLADNLGPLSKQISAMVARVATSTKTTASMLGDGLSQQKLLTATKGCAVQSQQLLLSAKSSQQSSDEKAQDALKIALRDLISGLENLGKTTESILAEATIGDKKINAAKAEILRMFDRFKEADFYGNQSASVFDVVDSAKTVATSTANLLSSSTKSQDELVESAKQTAKETNQLLSNMKGILRLAKDANTKKAIPEAAGNTVTAMTHLFDSVKNQGGRLATVLGQQRLSESSEKIADAIAEVLASLSKLPGADKVVVEDNADEKAEEELNATAKVLETAATALAKVTATANAKDFSTSELEQMQLSEAIIESTRAIIAATSTLVKLSATVQKDLTAKEKASGTNKKLNKFYRKDSIFAEGLISAAKAVGTTIQQLVKSANATAQGTSEEEALIAATKSVSAATAQLVAASKVKSPDNPNQGRLQDAAKAVASAASMLVSSASAAAEKKEEEERAKRTDKHTGSIIQEMEQQMKILKLEKELEKARQQMKQIRTQNYQ